MSSIMEEINLRNPYPIAVLKIAGYLHVAPFHVEFSKDNPDKIVVKPEHILRKVLCGIIHATMVWANLVGVFNQFSIISVNFITSGTMSTAFTQTFLWVGNIGSLVFFSSLIYTFWTGQEAIGKCIQNTSTAFSEKLNRKHQILYSVFALIIVINLTGGYFITSGMFNELIKFESILITLKEICNFYILLASQVCLMFLLSIVIAIDKKSNGFCKGLQTGTPEQVLNSFRALKQVSNDIEDLFGTEFLAYYVITVSYYAVFPEKHVWSSYSRIFSNFGYLFVAGLIFFFSARVHSKVQRNMQKWISSLQTQKDLSKDDKFELCVAFNENLMSPVGISCKFFTFTYGFLGSTFSLIVTYGIIIFQVSMCKA